MQAALIGVADIHAGAKTDGFEPFQFLNLIGTIRLIGGDVSGVEKFVNFVGHGGEKGHSTSSR